MLNFVEQHSYVNRSTTMAVAETWAAAAAAETWAAAAAAAAAEEEEKWVAMWAEPVASRRNPERVLT